MFLSLISTFLFLTMANANITREKCLNQTALICILQSTGNNRCSDTSQVTGKVYFRPFYRKGDCNVRIVANVFGLLPGNRGFHIHSYGDLSSNDGKSTGGHFLNPDNAEIEHGYPNSTVRHWGDLGNLETDKNGRALYRRIDTVLSLQGILGRGIIVHDSEDLGPEFQPSGNAGSRIASCVIGIANPDLF